MVAIALSFISAQSRWVGYQIEFAAWLLPATRALPTITVPGAQTIGVNKAASIYGVSLSESGNTAGETFTVTLSDTSGLLSASNSAGATVIVSNGNKTLTISGSLTQVNAALGTLTDSEATNASDSITLNATDSFGNAAPQQAIAVTAKANWTGDTLAEYYYWPTLSNLYWNGGTFVAPASGLNGSYGQFSLSVSSNSITASNFSSNGAWDDSSFNGFEIIDQTHALISGVTIDPVTNMAGLSSGRISFGSNFVEVNWHGLSFNTGTIVKLDLTFDPPIDASSLTLAQTLDGSARPASNRGILTVADGAEVALVGTIYNTGTIAVNASTAATAIEVVGSVTLQGGGRIDLSQNNQNYIFGSDNGASLTNVDNTISGDDDIGNGSLVFANAGLIQTQGSYALLIDTGTNPFVNTGTLETDGGTLIVKSPTTGGGNAIIAGGTLEFSSAADTNVDFSGSDMSMLALDESRNFTGQISDFDASDQIDLRDIAFGANTTLGYSGDANGGALTVSDGAITASIALLGNYMTAAFATASDGQGGTLISETTLPVTSQQPFLAQSHV
jgi:hypothetical protein